MRLAEKKDSGRLLEWRNGFGARKYSKNSELISWEDHEAWLDARISSTEIGNGIYIFSNSRVSIGMVRFDTSDRAYAEISILVDPLFQGKGVGSLILQHSVEYALNHLDLLEIHAWIHISNIASRKLFTKCGFVKVRSEGFFDFYKLSNLI